MPTTMYDIFISYRREGGFETAKHIFDLLRNDGYRVSFDIDTLRNGNFDTSLLQRIDECKDFILIVDAHAFDRTLNPNFPPSSDWLRQELAHALKRHKNIIPIFLNGVDAFPQGLPADISDVTRKNGPKYNREYFDEFYRRLKNNFLTSSRHSLNFEFIVRLKSLIHKAWKYVAIGTVVIVLGILAGWAMYTYIPTLSLNDNTAKSSKMEINELMHKAEEAYKAKDYAVAFEYYSKAAEAGDANAQNKLGILYQRSWGTEQNYTKALKWYKLAAEQGHTEAQTWLGYMYENGYGTEQDFVEAIKWYKLAAEHGYDFAQYNIGFMYLNGIGVQQSDKDAAKWIRLAAEQGLAIAQNDLGGMYETGSGVKQDYAEALKWYKLAAEQGDERAQNNIGRMYLHGIGVQQDNSESLKWFKLAAKQGFALAQNHLGGMYENGLGVKQDYKEALKWYNLAAEQGDDAAKANIGYLYLKGLGVTQNTAEAKKWFKLAAEQGFEPAKKVLKSLGE